MSGGWPSSPEFGNSLGVSISTASSRYGLLTVTTTASYIKNAYTQLTAATSSDIHWLEVDMRISGQPIFTNYYADIAVGAGGSEQVIINNLAIGVGSGAAAAGARTGFPVNIPSGSRVAATFAYTSSTTTTTNAGFVLGFQGYEGGMTMGEGFSLVDSINSNNGLGTNVATGGVNNTKGTYVQLTAATTRDYAGFLVGGVPGGGLFGFLVDVAVGAGGVEKNILSNYTFPENSGNAMGCQLSGAMMVPIPSGTRISARAQGSNVSTVNVTVYGIA